MLKHTPVRDDYSNVQCVPNLLADPDGAIDVGNWFWSPIGSDEIDEGLHLLSSMISRFRSIRILSACPRRYPALAQARPNSSSHPQGSWALDSVTIIVSVATARPPSIPRGRRARPN